jgi:hypothetical protein
MRDSDRANEIVESVRGLFKPTAQHKTMIEMNSIVQQVLKMVENDLHVNGVTVSTKFQDNPPQIMAHPATASNLEPDQERDRGNGRWSYSHKDPSAGNDPRRELGRLAFCPRLRTRNKPRKRDSGI